MNELLLKTAVRVWLMETLVTGFNFFVLMNLIYEPFIVSWTKLDTGVFVLPETALGSYSSRLQGVESTSRSSLVRAI